MENLPIKERMNIQKEVGLILVSLVDVISKIAIKRD
jgi:hypothetical protein